MLPDDILFLICEQLRLVSDFNTLFNCSITSKNFAAAALPNLWRIHDNAPCSARGPEEKLDLRKWMTLWRTLILSTFPGRTYASYFRYIRVLSLRDLELLFDERDFRLSGKKAFFKDLAEFYGPFKKVENIPPYRFAEWSTAILQVTEAIGDRITDQCMELARTSGRKSVLEELDGGEIKAEPMRRFILRVNGLKTLRAYHGKSLSMTGPLLRENCPKFDSLTFYEWNEPTTGDEELAELLRGLRPQTLKLLEVISSAEGSALTASALSEHNTSLTELKFSSALAELVTSLPLIGSCPNLTTFQLDIRTGTVISLPDDCQAIGNWMSSCSSLTELVISQSSQGLNTAMLIPLLNSMVKLVKLDVRSYIGQAASDFHRALAEQRDSLQYLTLRGDPDDLEEIVFVHTITQLTQLRDLQLHGLSNFFNNNNIKQIALSLPLLEEFAISGWNITDAIWPALSQLRFLRRLDLSAFSTFTLTGILGYVDTLGEGNRGLALSITMADPFSALMETEQEIVREALVAKVEGRFDYMPGRDPNASDSDSDSD